MQTATMPTDIATLQAAAKAHRQEQLFAFYDTLNAEQQKKLVAQIGGIDFKLIDRLVAEHVQQKGHVAPPGKLEPPPVIPIPRTPEEKKREGEAFKAGEAVLRANRVACFLVAGGQGTRLGLHGPKGAFEIGPISKRTLFQIFAEKILALRRRYNAAIPWLIMTSDANDAETKEFFKQHNYFDLGDATVAIFKQENLPAVGRDGRILLAEKNEVALSPNGHGGSIKAIADSGSLAWLKTQHIDTLFYFQVDNPLVKICDPVFIGYHAQARSEMSTKVCRKRDWKEKVGVLGLRDGKLSVIEYSDLPESVARETDAQGDLKWWGGNIAIHILDVNFIERLNKGGFQLPYHKAEKAVAHIGPDGRPAALKPGEKNGVKFETFIFDALAQAQRTVNLETRREDDFSPVKNADGDDSPATCRRDMMEQYARWLTAAGSRVPRKPDGALDCRIEISPLHSVWGENLSRADIQPGADVLL